MRIPDITFIRILTLSLYWNSSRCKIRPDRATGVGSSVTTIQWASQGLKSVCVAEMLIRVASTERFSPAQVLLWAHRGKVSLRHVQRCRQKHYEELCLGYYEIRIIYAVHLLSDEKTGALPLQHLPLVDNISNILNADRSIYTHISVWI